MVKRFWDKVKIGAPEDCWPWTRCLFKNGYGKFAMPNSRLKEYAHRVAFTLAGGTIEPKQVIMHSCDNKKCCNPAHLSAGTMQENSIDARDKGLLWPRGKQFIPEAMR